MSIMDLFKSSPSDNKDNGTTNTDPSKAGKEDLSASPSSTNKDGKMPGTSELPENPLDSYAKMFENAAKNSDIQAPEFKLDSKIVDEVSSKLDFTKDVNQEMMTKALSGDVKALLSVIQSTSQNAYKAAISHGTSLTDTFIKQRSEFDLKNINKGVKDGLTTQALSDAPNFDHPVIKSELNRIAGQFARANPDASPNEIAKAAKQYVTDIASALNPTSAVNTKDKPSDEIDWSKYMNGND